MRLEIGFCSLHVIVKGSRPQNEKKGKLHVDSECKLLGGKEFRKEINSTKKKLVLQTKYEKFIFKVLRPKPNS
jgi:hypothetical protein